MDDLAAQARAVARALRSVPAEVRRDIGREVKAQVVEPLVEAVASAAGGGPWGSVIAGGVKARTGTEPTLVVGGATAVLSGGGAVRDVVWAVEFGANPEKKSIVNRERSTSKRGGAKRGRVTAGEVRAQRAAGKVIFVRRSARQFIGRHRPFLAPTFRREEVAITEAWADIVTHRLDAAFEAGS